jgi:proteasome lid subunit RPN8/RPN11
MTQQESRSFEIRAPWERLLPLLTVFSGTTLLAVVLLIPLCWYAVSKEGPVLPLVALLAATGANLCIIAANVVVWLLVLKWGRPRPEALPDSTAAPTAHAAPVPEPNSALQDQPSVVEVDGRACPSQRPAAVEPASVPDCVMDEDLWEELKTYLEKFPRKEQGGIVLGYRQNNRTYFSAVILPQQLRATSVWCEFPTEHIGLVREACDRVADMPGAEKVSTVVAWIHTHPHLGVFLSGTDRDTLKQWQGLDSQTRAAVVDVFARGFEDQLGVFDGDGQPVGVALESAALPGELVESFLRHLQEIHEHHNRELPEVFLAGMEVNAHAPC